VAFKVGSGSSPTYRSATHKKARAAMLAAYRPGDPCCLCGHPMYPPTSTLHADHDPANPSRYRGLAHGTTPCQDCGVRCNVVDGAKRARARQIKPTAWKL
jgi:hypothetical protein